MTETNDDGDDDGDDGDDDRDDGDDVQQLPDGGLWDNIGFSKFTNPNISVEEGGVGAHNAQSVDCL